MEEFKKYASRALRRTHTWARHGSTRYLWDQAGLEAAVDYVVNRQGEPMAVFNPFADLPSRDSNGAGYGG